MNKKGRVGRKITIWLMCLVMMVTFLPLPSIVANAKELNLHFDHVESLDNCASALDLIYDEASETYTVKVTCDGLDTIIGHYEDLMGTDEQINWWITDEVGNYVVSTNHVETGLPLPTEFTDFRSNVSLEEGKTYRLYCVGVDDYGNYLVTNPDYMEFAIPVSTPVVKDEFTEQPIDLKEELGKTLYETFTFKGDIVAAFLEKEVDGEWKDWNSLSIVSEEQYQLEFSSPKSECVEKYRIGVNCTGSTWIYSDEFTITWEGNVWKNLRWDGNIARWDDYAGATNYWVWLYKNGSCPSGTGYSSQSNNYIDFTDLMTLYGSGDYTFYVVPFLDGKWDDSQSSHVSGVNSFVLPDATLEAPTNLRWDNVIAIWEPSENGQMYSINLYKEGELVKSSINAGENTFAYLDRYMDEYGTGKYSFEVCAFGVGTVSEWSVKSEETSYTQIPTPTGLKLDGTIASWKPVDKATNYWYRLYKDGVEVNVGYTGNTSTYDFAEKMKEFGEGVYDFSVAAYVSGVIGRTSKLASEEVVHEHVYTKTIKKATTSANGEIVETCDCGDVKKTTIYYPKTVKLSTTTYTYDGKVKKPSVSVVGSDGKTISSTNYTVTYPSGRKNVGKYTVKVTFKGNYSGTKSVTFKINPPKTSISKLSAGSKRFTVKWSKKSTQVTGYQIQYSTSSTFASGNKTTTVTSYKTTSKTIKSLKAKKKYYVRIRTYKTVSGTKYYSAWSASKAITTK